MSDYAILSVMVLRIAVLKSRLIRGAIIYIKEYFKTVNKYTTQLNQLILMKHFKIFEFYSTLQKLNHIFYIFFIWIQYDDWMSLAIWITYWIKMFLWVPVPIIFYRSATWERWSNWFVACYIVKHFFDDFNYSTDFTGWLDEKVFFTNFR